jgi:hypothetical protein
MRNNHTKFRTFLWKGETQPEQLCNQLKLWLRAALMDGQRRGELQSLLQQPELPVIQVGKTPKRMHRTTTRLATYVNPAKT